MDIKDGDRLKYLSLLFIALFAVVSARILWLQVVRSSFYKHLAREQYYKIIPLEGRRGTILDRRGRPLATCINSYSVYADPLYVADVPATARALREYLDVDESALEAKLSRKNRFIWLQRKITWADKQNIQALKLPGIGFIREGKRFYPQERLAAAVLGVTDVDNKGIDGLELYYDKFLSGKDGKARILQDSASRAIIMSPEITTPQDGADVTLTIDAQLQYWTEDFLADTVVEFGAKEGSVVIMDAANGEVLALANYPDFNPNNVTRESVPFIKNRAVCDMFEPGSIFKIITLVGALEMRAFRDTDSIDCENGSWKVPGTTLHDWHPYGKLSFVDVFKKSSNIGVAKIAGTFGKEKIYAYIRRFGFGEKTGIDLPGEENGIVKPLRAWSNTSPYIMPIGQEIGVNLFQMVRAMGAIANGGYLVRPFIVKTISSPGFRRECAGELQKIFDEKIALHAQRILVGVVEEGTGRLAKVEGLRIGGKTGTAQKFDVSIGRYSPDKYRASFVGFIEYPGRPLVMGVSIDEPAKSHFGGVVAASLFGKIARKAGVYMASIDRQMASHETRNAYSPFTAQQ